MGINMPNMGMKEKPAVYKIRKGTSLADALFSTIQQRVLAYLFGQPERSFFATELIKLAGGGSGAVQRELARLEDSGLVVVTRLGTQKHYQANPKSPIFSELCGIAQKTVGLAEPLRDALKPLAKRIAAAFVYGSVAKKQDTATSDIDLMVISGKVTYSDLFDYAGGGFVAAWPESQCDRVLAAGTGEAREAGQCIRQAGAGPAQDLAHR